MSDHANQPRWTGRAGFSEIWFLVVFDPSGKRAWWLRYTLFSPAPGTPGEPRATLWAAAFDTASAPPVVAMKSIRPITTFNTQVPGLFGIRLDGAELSPGRCTGSVRSAGHAITWDLGFTPASFAVRREPWIIQQLPLPTRVSHSHDDLAFSGTVTVDGQEHALQGAPGLQKHLWGRHQVDELYWVYCPRFQEDPRARLELVSTRPWRTSCLRFSPLHLRSESGTYASYELPGLAHTCTEVPGLGEFRFQSTAATVSLRGRAWCDPGTLAGYAYRDPRGWDAWVAQSDVASCELEQFSRPNPFSDWKPAGRLTSTCAALEFHTPKPLDGVRYIGWDETSLPESPYAMASSASRNTG